MCQNKFDPITVSTIGVQVSTRKFIAPFEERQQVFTVHFWDICGDINNRELLPSFFKSVMGIIYVFDLTNQSSLDNLPKWK
jgi:GTPase SAR1 family protein